MESPISAEETEKGSRGYLPVSSLQKELTSLALASSNADKSSFCNNIVRTTEQDRELDEDAETAASSSADLSFTSTDNNPNFFFCKRFDDDDNDDNSSMEDIILLDSTSISSTAEAFEGNVQQLQKLERRIKKQKRQQHHQKRMLFVEELRCDFLSVRSMVHAKLAELAASRAELRLLELAQQQQQEEAAAVKTPELLTLVALEHRIANLQEVIGAYEVEAQRLEHTLSKADDDIVLWLSNSWSSSSSGGDSRSTSSYESESDLTILSSNSNVPYRRLPTNKRRKVVAKQEKQQHTKKVGQSKNRKSDKKQQIPADIILVDPHEGSDDE